MGAVDGTRSGGGGEPSPDVARRRRWVIGAIVGVVVLISVVVLATGGSSGKGGAFRSYFGRLVPVATGSQRVGASLNQILAKVQHAQISDPSSKLEHLVKQAQTQLAAAQALKPPAGLQPEHAQALFALALRVTGLQGLQAVLGHPSSSGANALTANLAEQINRLVTSDVIWRDLFLQPAGAALRQLRLPTSLAPKSVFVANTDLSSPQAIASLVQPQAPAAAPALRLGSTGAAVAAWQKQLNRWLGLKHLTAVTADGAFGPGTQAATESLQRAAALPPDGVVGPATRKALATALASRG
jgi:murein L,D-transpeptidase YcbB/YkuD